MVYTPQTKKALKLCFEAHRDQTDKSGLPYVFHPFHLAEQMRDEDTTVVALLHDVVEDTPYTLDDLKKMGFSDVVITALALMTHEKPVPYLQYVWKIRKNPVARAVKQADLQHNSDLSRLESVSDKDRARVLKYKMALAILSEHRKDEGSYRFEIPLDDRSLYYLSVFYSEVGLLKYSLDAEYADDVHYIFSAKDSDRIMAVLPCADSLPEALAVYLNSHNEENFATLLKKNNIPYERFHYCSR